MLFNIFSTKTGQRSCTITITSFNDNENDNFFCLTEITEITEI